MKEVGLQWLINSRNSFEKNVQLAIARHFVRYASTPTVANANPEDLKEPVTVDGLLVLPHVSCPKGCLFVGRKI
jgi:hypothetical protein